MTHYPYLIVGGGMTADAAIGGIREIDSSGTIGLIGADPHPPYDRPPLTKGLWKDKLFESVWRETDRGGVTLHLSRTVQTLDPANKRVTDDQGDAYSFDKLLLATGGASPAAFPSAATTSSTTAHSTITSGSGGRRIENEQFTVIGGGFIGWEIAAALKMNGKKVVMVFPDDGIGGRVFPADLARFLNDFYTRKGIEVLAGELAVGWETRGGKPVLKTHNERTQSDREIESDAVVAGLGIQPNVDLARAAGLEVENGIRVDSGLRTSHPDVFAAGDVANYYNPVLDRRFRSEHEDNANTMGKMAGQAMAGQAISYDYLPFFYSDLFDLGFEAVGEVDARLETVADWKEPFREGVVYYMRDGRVRGVLLWNVWDQVDAARRLIAEPGPLRPGDLKNRLPA